MIPTFTTFGPTYIAKNPSAARATFVCEAETPTFYGGSPFWPTYTARNRSDAVRARCQCEVETPIFCDGRSPAPRFTSTPTVCGRSPAPRTTFDVPSISFEGIETGYASTIESMVKILVELRKESKNIPSDVKDWIYDAVQKHMLPCAFKILFPDATAPGIYINSEMHRHMLSPLFGFESIESTDRVGLNIGGALLMINPLQYYVEVMERFIELMSTEMANPSISMIRSCQFREPLVVSEIFSRMRFFENVANAFLHGIGDPEIVENLAGTVALITGVFALSFVLRFTGWSPVARDMSYGFYYNGEIGLYRGGPVYQHMYGFKPRILKDLLAGAAHVMDL